MEPYIPAFFHVYDLQAADVGLTVNRTADLRLAPNIGSYVGGDISAGVSPPSCGTRTSSVSLWTWAPTARSSSATATL